MTGSTDDAAAASVFSAAVMLGRNMGLTVTACQSAFKRDPL
jgi:hypothetical protein